MNSAIGDRALPELGPPVGFNSHSSTSDIASLIVNAFGLELPRRLQSSFFEVVQRASNDSNGEISHEGVIKLFQSTYGYYPMEGPVPKLSLSDFKLEKAENYNHRFIGDIVADGDKKVSVYGVGNGPLSATLAALCDIIDGVLTIREYSVHSVGEGTEMLEVSYVDLAYEVFGAQTSCGWGISADTNIFGSGIKAVLTAASNIGVVLKV